MSEKSSSKPSVQDVVAPAFEIQGKLNEAIVDPSVVWDRTTKLRTRKEVNRLKDMMDEVLKMNKGDIPEDVIDGMREVIVNTEAKLDNKPMHFSADEELDVADTKRMAA